MSENNRNDVPDYLIENQSEESESEGEEHKGALKVTRIRNKRYIRMPNFSKRQVGILRNWLQGNLESPYLSLRDYDQLSR